MNIRITSVNINYDETGKRKEAEIHFNIGRGDYISNLNGYILLSDEEYSGNEGSPALEETTRLKIIDWLENGGVEAEG